MCWVVLFQALSRGVGIEDYKANTYQVGDKMVEYQEITHQTNSLLVLEEAATGAGDWSWTRLK